MRYAGVFKGGRTKQEDRTHRMSFGNLQGALESPRQLEGVHRKATPAGAKAVCLRKQIEIAEGYPRIRLLARRLPRRGGDNHAGRVAEDDIVATQNFINIAAKHGIEQLKDASADKQLQLLRCLATKPLHELRIPHHCEMELMIVTPGRHPGEGVNKSFPDVLGDWPLPPVADAPALSDERRLRCAVWNWLDIKSVVESDAIASDRPARAHGKTVLTVNAKLFILRPDGRYSVSSRRQNVNYAVAHTRAARYAFLPVDVYHFYSIQR